VNGHKNLVLATPVDFFKFGPGRPPIFGLLDGTYELPQREDRMNGVERAATPSHEVIEDIIVEDTGPKRPAIRQEVPFFEFDPPRLPHLFNDPAYMHNKR
jgi:hypothetical protein